jgi:hypothetical protein
VDCRAELPGCTAMEDYTRVSLAPAFRIGPSPEFRVLGALFLIVPGPQSLVYILLASAAIAVEVEATSAKLAGCHCRDQRYGLCPRCLLWRFPGHNWPGSVQHRGTTSVCLCRDPAVHGREQCDGSGTTFGGQDGVTHKWIRGESLRHKRPMRHKPRGSSAARPLD